MAELAAAERVYNDAGNEYQISADSDRCESSAFALKRPPDV
ncbi:hypothetical protein ApDm4_2677 [Acetobacter pomorum]|nr:hypothetical protein ApDm4_2677 [Acetobacter pomorum]